MTNIKGNESKVVPYSQKNCNIIMKDGTVRFNDRALGWNLDKDGILECLQDTGRYDLFTQEKGWEPIHTEDVKEIVEVEG